MGKSLLKSFALECRVLLSIRLEYSELKFNLFRLFFVFFFFYH